MHSPSNIDLYGEDKEAANDTQRTLALKEIIEFKVNKVRTAEVNEY